MTAQVSVPPIQLPSTTSPFLPNEQYRASWRRVPNRHNSLALASHPSDPPRTIVNRAIIAIKSVIPKLKLFIPDAILPSNDRDEFRVRLGQFKEFLEQFEHSPKRTRGDSGDTAWKEASEELVTVRDGLQRLDRRLSAESSRGRQIAWEHSNHLWIGSKMSKVENSLRLLIAPVDDIDQSGDEDDIRVPGAHTDYTPPSQSVRDPLLTLSSWQPRDMDYLGSLLDGYPKRKQSQDPTNQRNTWYWGQTYEDGESKRQSTNPLSWLPRPPTFPVMDCEDESDSSEEPETPAIENLLTPAPDVSSQDPPSSLADSQTLAPSEFAKPRELAIAEEDHQKQEEDEWFFVDSQQNTTSAPLSPVDDDEDFDFEMLSKSSILEAKETRP